MELTEAELRWLLWVLTTYAAQNRPVGKQRRWNNAAIDKLAKRLRRVERLTDQSL